MDGVQIPRPHGDLDYHRMRDQARLAERVKGDVDINKLVLERPKEAIPEKEENVVPVVQPVRKQPAVIHTGVLKQGGADSDPVMRERRDKVREVKHLHFFRKAYENSYSFVLFVDDGAFVAELRRVCVGGERTATCHAYWAFRWYLREKQTRGYHRRRHGHIVHHGSHGGV